MDAVMTRLKGWATSGDESRPVRVIPALALVAAMLVLLGMPPATIWTMGLVGLGVVLTWMAPSVMIALVLVTVPIQEGVMLPYVGGDLTLTQIAVFGLAAGWALSFWRYRILIDAITLW